MTPEQQLLADHKHVISDPAGERFLTHWLIALGHFDIVEPDNQEMIIRQNIAKELLTKCGLWPNSEQYVQNLPRREEHDRT